MNKEQEEKISFWIGFVLLSFGFVCIMLLILAVLVRWVVSWQW